MDFLIASAMAQDAAQQPSAMPSLIICGLRLIVFWVLRRRPPRQRNTDHREL
ncbi:MAG: hypothetical protein LAT56_09775 [Wenzhouxiangella sp.]|nr:hypothetical protein [Wenzhouxiangella sp.]